MWLRHCVAPKISILRIPNAIFLSVPRTFDLRHLPS
ncbi:hypothetical protein SLEP1_g36056 [Rubroshorea leprosula]|uniref:Uncharacterized protein n=1 Tax=Rubroshorea leprosula TaxID=152421 RepID=A0AAV5KQC5_9ROSI|nr:hypothetical protein SLEP1_g36056 [Rubroshorea leprosula]